MGTRGMIGFQIDGNVIGAYNHFDSYPEVTGRKIAKAVAQITDPTRLDTYIERARNIRCVDDRDEPTAEDVEQARKLNLIDLEVSGQTVDEYYVILRGAQGDLKVYLDLGVIPEASGFGKDSLFCEFAYLYNFDRNVIECFRGVNQDPDQQDERFALTGEQTEEARKHAHEVHGSRDDAYFGIRKVGEVSVWDARQGGRPGEADPAEALYQRIYALYEADEPEDENAA
jgi:hypothetical protein